MQDVSKGPFIGWVNTFRVHDRGEGGGDMTFTDSKSYFKIDDE